ncbi:RICIN domain-containing protein [Plantactinospora soyae]|uniref:PAS domain-containing protein n=1 Tax=Plantactinospora soyae TaxID=1544732 RepID=A0A927MCY0_9ACTN|nr:RICIN domain-containing protein [Plantactinospora soyae]MBE1489458.1 PAS domain-containing protein [Plantactinospora soyae]
MAARRGMTRVASATLAATLGVAGVAVPHAVAGAASAAGAAGVTIRIDPSYQQQPFQGWGTSLVWFANATGGYPDEVRNRLVDLLFGEDGLRLNIARYNIGGGNAPTVDDYLRRGGAVPGFWRAPQPYGPGEKEWWDPDNPDHWNWDADANQRWWIDQIKDRVDTWEAFSNSPPWFQTVSGYVSGGFDPNAEQIRADRVDEFADYLVRVTEHIEREHGIAFDTIDPLNEPNTPYWRTTLGPDGRPTGGRQEGAHVGPALQAQVVLALRRRLDTASTDAAISAPDETNPGIFLQDWYGYPAEAQAAVSQLNVHTYGTGQRTAARDVAKAEGRPLWMSEVEGSWGNDFTSMDSGLGMARRIIDDLRELEPAAWVLWQPVEDAENMVAEGNLQWGSIHVPFTCTSTDTLASCPIRTNTKFDTIRNFTHHIRPGDRLVKVDDTASVAAVKESGRGAVVVHANADTSPRAVTLDLSRFAEVGAHATVTPVLTSAEGKLVRGRPVRVERRSATLTVPGESVSTFLIDGVRAGAGRPQHIQPGHAYRLQGVQSGRSLAPSTDGARPVLGTTDTSRPEQLWYVRKLGHGAGNRDRYTIGNAGTGRRLAVRGGATVLEGADTAADQGAQWILSTTGDGTYTFVNVAARRVLDVSGGATEDGSPVSVWQPTGSGNQRWAALDETVASTEAARLHTVPGRVPALPQTVTAVLYSGERRSLPVTWHPPPDGAWRRPGVVTVRGVATDVLDRRVPATTRVTVDTFTATEPARAKAYAGGQPDLPATVTGLGAHDGTATLPVSWEPPPVGAFDRPGVVTLTGVARVVDGTELPASVRVQVTGPAQTNVALADGATVAATFTEGGYSPAGLRNGVTAEKAWSNWRSGTQNPSETISVTLPRPADLLRVVTHFHRDSIGGGGLAASLRVQVRDAGGTCVDASGEVAVGTEGAPAVDVPVTAPVTDGVCVLLTPRPGGYLTLGEIEVMAKAPGVSSDATLASIAVDGVPITGFDPDRTDYRVSAARPGRSTVTATASDPYATTRIVRDTSTRRTTWTISTTSEDGSQRRTYRVTVTPR